MLDLLHIENIAVIESADIEFGRGLNVMTGETGAGKSIVIDSIGAVLGQRASRDLIRTGAQAASVSASFSDLPRLAWFEENAIEPDEGGCLVLTRRMLADGKNICRVNGSPVTVAQLRSLGAELISIHGQHDTLQLFDEKYQLRFVDSFGGAELGEYRARYGEYRSICAEMDELCMDENEKAEKMETLTARIAEIERAQLTPGEDEALEGRRYILRNAEKLSDSVKRAFYAFNGEEDSGGGIYAELMEAERALSTALIRASNESITMLAGNVSKIRYAAGDALEELRSLMHSFEFSEEELDGIEARLDVIKRLTRKYGEDVPSILASLEKYRAELDKIEYAGDRLARLEKQLAGKKAECVSLASELTAKRKDAASKLRERILGELSQLEMPKARLEIEVTPAEMGPDGADAVSFMMSTNPGESLRPVSRIASGGELSRIMLAMKVVMAENDSIGTLIFDEVDSGVSGRAAQRVGAKLREAARCRQVLSVTHLAQVAAFADTHLKVVKNTGGERTNITVSILSENEHIDEVARIISGDEITEASRRHAAEMIGSAK